MTFLQNFFLFAAFQFYVYISNKIFRIISLKIIFSEKATNFCEISTLVLSYVVTVKSPVEISQNFVAFSEYMNFSSIFFVDK